MVNAWGVPKTFGTPQVILCMYSCLVCYTSSGKRKKCKKVNECFKFIVILSDKISLKHGRTAKTESSGNRSES